VLLKLNNEMVKKNYKNINYLHISHYLQPTKNLRNKIKIFVLLVV